jgi:hypothetical protein
MKYLLLLLLLVSCSIPVEKVGNGKELTTLEILELPSDTMEVKILNDKIYLLDDGVVSYVTNVYHKDYLQMRASVFFPILIIMAFLSIFGLIFLFDE